MPPRGPQDGPRGGQDGPRGAQTAQEHPKAAPKTGTRNRKFEPFGPRDPQETPRRSKKGPRSPKRPLYPGARRPGARGRCLDRAWEYRA
eukprot:8392024-Pyramimonas_sp.AAC.1